MTITEEAQKEGLEFGKKIKCDLSSILHKTNKAKKSKEQIQHAILEIQCFLYEQTKSMSDMMYEALSCTLKNEDKTANDIILAFTMGLVSSHNEQIKK